MLKELADRFKDFAEVFHKKGKRVYLVGGAVRNDLLKREVKDFDFTTDALPEEVRRLFPRVIPTGIAHGTVTVLFQGSSLEVTTFRVDGKYSDSRRPDSVTFTPSLEEDLKRRDFTINALALDLKNGALIDLHGGAQDLENKVLRAIGDPSQRFQEDALRILRLFRFASQLGFSIDPDTLASVPPLQDRLQFISKERVREELQKLVLSAHPELGLSALQKLGILNQLFPLVELRNAADEDLKSLEKTNPAVRWPLLLKLLSVRTEVKTWEEQLRELTFPNAEIQEVSRALNLLGSLTADPPTARAVKGLIEASRTRNWSLLFELVAQAQKLTLLIWSAEEYEAWTEALQRTLAKNEPVFLSELALTGDDLITSGWRPGPSLGQALKALQLEVWDHPEKNTKETLRDLAVKWTR